LFLEDFPSFSHLVVHLKIRKDEEKGTGNNKNLYNKNLKNLYKNLKTFNTFKIFSALSFFLIQTHLVSLYARTMARGLLQSLKNM
jgi:hypothetical protein